MQDSPQKDTQEDQTSTLRQPFTSFRKFYFASEEEKELYERKLKEEEESNQQLLQHNSNSNNNNLRKKSSISNCLTKQDLIRMSSSANSNNSNNQKPNSTTSPPATSPISVTSARQASGQGPTTSSPNLSRQSSTNSLKGANNKIVSAVANNNNNNNNRRVSAVDSEDSIESIPRMGMLSPANTNNTTNTNTIVGASAKINNDGSDNIAVHDRTNSGVDDSSIGILPPNHGSVVLPVGVRQQMRNMNMNNDNEDLDDTSFGRDLRINSVGNGNNNDSRRSSGQSASTAPPHSTTTSHFSTTSFDERAANIRPPAITTSSPNQRTISIPFPDVHHQSGNNNSGALVSPRSPISPFRNRLSSPSGGGKRRGGDNLDDEDDDAVAEREEKLVEEILSKDLRDWAEYYNAPKGTGFLISPFLRRWAGIGPVLHLVGCLIHVALLVSAITLFLYKDEGRNHPYWIPITVLAALPIMNTIWMTVHAVVLSSNVDMWVAKAVQHTIMSALTEPSYRVFLSGLKQTDARILWAADSLSKAVPFLDSSLIEEICQGPPPSFCTRDNNNNMMMSSANNNLTQPKTIHVQSAEVDDCNHNNNNRWNNNNNDNDINPESPTELQGTLAGMDLEMYDHEGNDYNNNNCNGMENPLKGRQQKNSRANSSVTSVNTNHVEGAGDDMDSDDLSSISTDSESEENSSRSRPTNENSQTNSRAPSCQPGMSQQNSHHGASGVGHTGSTLTSHTNSLFLHSGDPSFARTSSTATQHLTSISSTTTTSTSHLTGHGGPLSPGYNMMNSRAASTGFSPMPSFRSDLSSGNSGALNVSSSLDSSNNQTGSPAGLASGRARALANSRRKGSASFRSAALATRASMAFGTSKQPYQNTAQARSVVVANFAFYYNRHGSQRPPPAISANEIVREFISAASQCVTKFKGQIYSIQPNAVVAYWEIGSSASSLTCEFNACSASKDFAKIMKNYKLNSLTSFQEKFLATPHANNQQAQHTQHTLNKGLKSFRAKAPASHQSSGDTNNNNNNNMMATASDNALMTILSRSNFTVGISKGTVMKGTLGTQQKASNLLFGPVVQKAAILAEVGIKVQASVILSSSIYFPNNMTFVMRPVEDIEVPKWLSEGKLGGKSSGGHSYNSNNNYQQGQSASATPFRVVATPNPPENNTMVDGGMATNTSSSNSSMASPSAAAVASTAASNNNAMNSNYSSDSSVLSAMAGSATAAGGHGGGRKRVIATSQQQQHQQQQQSMNSEIETVYQLLSVKSGDDDPSKATASKENEWMYLLERHGGAQLHDMSVAFDAFRSGNLTLAANIFNGLSNKAREANFNDRYVLLRYRQLQPQIGALGGAGGNSSGNMREETGGELEQDDNSNGNSGGQQRTTVDNMSMSALPDVLRAISDARHVQSSVDVFSNNNNNNNNNNTGAPAAGVGASSTNNSGKESPSASGMTLNPKRQALDSYFNELKCTGLKYSRRVHVTGVDDLPFE